MYTTDVKLSFPNNGIKKCTLSIFTFYVTILTSFQENDSYAHTHTHTHTHTNEQHTQTHLRTDRPANKQTDIVTMRQTGTQADTCTHACKHTHTHTENRELHWHTNIQRTGSASADRHTDNRKLCWQTDTQTTGKYAGRQTCMHKKQADRQTNREQGVTLADREVGRNRGYTGRQMDRQAD